MPIKRHRVLGVLVTLTGISFIALIGLGWRSLNGFELTVSRVLQEGCGYAAQETALQIQRDLRSPVFNLLEQVDHAALKNYQIERIAEALRARAPQFPQIDTFFVWSIALENTQRLGSAPDRPILFYAFASKADASASARTPEPARANGFFVDPRLAEIIQANGLKFAELRKNFALTYVTFDGRTYHVLYHYLYDEDKQRIFRGYEGFLSDPQHLRQTYFRDLIARLGRERAQNAGEPIAVSIVDDGGTEVVRSGGSLQTAFDAEVPFPFLFFDTDLFDSLSPYRPEVRYWRVRTGYEAGDISTVVRRQSASQRWAWLLVGLMTVVGIVSIARATAREMRLAQMQSEFVASVSHDLKTPLSKIQLFAETLASGRAKTPAKAAIYQQRITVQAQKLGQLIGALLDFNKFEAGTSDSPFEELDLRAILRSCIESFEDELSQQNYKVEIALPGAEVPVLANGERLRQLFGNLISNALKYSPGERFLRISMTTENSHAVVELTDHGIGIPRAEQRKIFNKFYRGATAISMAASGSGLGLAIVDHVVRAHGGNISVTSAPGQGSTFRVELPVVSALEGGAP